MIGNSNPRFIRSTLYCLPATEDGLKLSSLPLGLVIQPMADLADSEQPVPIVDFLKDGPIRCNRCATYINPHFRFIDGGRLFTCNMCGHSNQVPTDYFCNLDMSGTRLDIQSRPELTNGTCDFLVQNEYCARPPVPLSHIFCVDVSWSSINSGMLYTFTNAIRSFLYSGEFKHPDGMRVGFITFDKTVHFYNLNSVLDQIQMMVVVDVEEMFVPLQNGLCVDYLESRSNIEQFLNTVVGIFANNHTPEACMGSACAAAYEALVHFGLILEGYGRQSIDFPDKLANNRNGSPKTARGSKSAWN